MYQQTASRLDEAALAVAADTAENDPRPRPLSTVARTRPRRYEADRRRYADLVDRRLAERLATEDAAVEAGLSPFERLTCPAHRRWVHQCIVSPQHVSPVTGHRWCRDCACPVTVAVDELAGDVTVTCPRCHHTPEGVATRQIVRACRASLATIHETRTRVTLRPLTHVDERRCA
jgi:hypothetical protein